MNTDIYGNGLCLNTKLRVLAYDEVSAADRSIPRRRTRARSIVQRSCRPPTPAVIIVVHNTPSGDGLRALATSH